MPTTRQRNFNSSGTGIFNIGLIGSGSGLRVPFVIRYPNKLMQVAEKIHLLWLRSRLYSSTSSLQIFVVFFLSFSDTVIFSKYAYVR